MKAPAYVTVRVCVCLMYFGGWQCVLSISLVLVVVVMVAAWCAICANGAKTLDTEDNCQLVFRIVCVCVCVYRYV